MVRAKDRLLFLTVIDQCTQPEQSVVPLAVGSSSCHSQAPFAAEVPFSP